MNLSPRRPVARQGSGAAVESWFLEHGVPAVLTKRARWRRLWPRSAPMLGAYATVEACGIPIYLLTGSHEVRIDGVPTTAEWIVLAIIALAVPVATLVGWLASRLASDRSRTVVAATAVAVAAIAGAIDGGLSQLPVTAVITTLTVLLTGCGVGAVLAWAVRMTLSHLAMVGAMAVRALPVVLLIALMFFNTYAWLMAATISRPRLWLAMLFLLTVAEAFVISGTLERVRPMLRSSAVLPKDSERLADTPFAEMPDPPASPPLSRAERINVIFVLVASQLVQILTVALVIAAIFFLLGLILLSPPVLAEWTHNGASDGTFLGMTLPVPEALIQISLFLVALAFMYISARAVGDGEYRSTFLDPLIDDLHATLIARNRYRGAIAAALRSANGSR